MVPRWVWAVVLVLVILLVLAYCGHLHASVAI
jgi:hypothetical protein